MRRSEEHGEVDHDKRASDNPPWQWCLHGCCGVVTLLLFDDEDVPEVDDDDLVTWS